MITVLIADSTRDVSLADAARCIRAIQGVDEGSFSIKPFYPENFLVDCHSSATRDRILAATPLLFAGSFLTLMPWTRLAHADTAVMKFKVAIELEGIPPHAWAEDTAAKILAPSCWLHTINQATTTKADLSAYKVTAWTSDPRAIPKVVWLHIAENEVVQISTNSGFGNLPPYIRRKKVLSYRVLVHLKHVTDFEPNDPTPPPSPPGFDDGDSGHDGNPEHHHFTRGPCTASRGSEWRAGSLTANCSPTTPWEPTAGGCTNSEWLRQRTPIQTWQLVRKRGLQCLRKPGSPMIASMRGPNNLYGAMGR